MAMLGSRFPQDASVRVPTSQAGYQPQFEEMHMYAASADFEDQGPWTAGQQQRWQDSLGQYSQNEWAQGRQGAMPLNHNNIHGYPGMHEQARQPEPDSDAEETEAVQNLTPQHAAAMTAWLSKGSLSDRRFALQEIGRLASKLCMNQLGSRVVQLALTLAAPEDQGFLIDGLRGHIRELAKCPHGNYAVQKCVDILSPQDIQFIIDEIEGRAVVIARHRFGCRILQRIMERCHPDQTHDLLDEVLSDGERLIRHPFANYVMQHIITYGTRHQRAQVMGFLAANAKDLSKHRIASHVLHHAYQNAHPIEKEALLQSLGGPLPLQFPSNGKPDTANDYYSQDPGFMHPMPAR